MSVKVEMTPSEQIVKQQSLETEIVDALGRKLTLRKPKYLQRTRLMEALGDSSSNAGYMSMVLPAAWVVKIDSDDVDMPMSKLELEALAQRLDDAGMEAITKHMLENVPKSEAEQKGEVKK